MNDSVLKLFRTLATTDQTCHQSLAIQFVFFASLHCSDLCNLYNRGKSTSWLILLDFVSTAQLGKENNFFFLAVQLNREEYDRDRIKTYSLRRSRSQADEGTRVRWPVSGGQARPKILFNMK